MSNDSRSATRRGNPSRGYWAVLCGLVVLTGCQSPGLLPSNSASKPQPPNTSAPANLGQVDLVGYENPPVEDIGGMRQGMLPADEVSFVDLIDQAAENQGSAQQDAENQDAENQDAGQGHLSLALPALESLIADALTTHPEIAAARQRVAAARARVPQAKALPDPMVGNTFWPIHDQALQTAGGRIGHQFALNQKVPWPTKLNAQTCVAMRDVQVALAEIAKVEREIVESVRMAYYDLWLADELIRIVQENQEVVSDLITISEERYKTGGSQQDILRAELEDDKLRDQRLDLNRNKEQARADLGALVHQSIPPGSISSDALNIHTISLELEQLIATAEQCNPVLKGLAAEIARDRAKESLACAQNYPDLQLGLGYSIVNDNEQVISPVANGHDNISFTVGVTLPIWKDKINAGIREAAHVRTSTINRREAERDRLRGQLRRQVAAADASIARLQLFQDRLIPRTQKMLDLATADYQGKQADFTDLVEIYQELLAYQNQLAQTKASLANTLAQIERTVGCEPVPTP